MSKEDWLTIEKLVKLIEESVAPNSIVEHNVFLPDLTSSSKRQCDIVITTGLEPRQTITIVEVQSRKSKLKLNDFQGFISKMQDVGAQHLICVSTIGFSKSIIEKSKRYGGTVRLMKLTKATDKLPINFPSLKFTYTYPKTFNIDDPEILFRGEFKFYLNEIKFIMSDNPTKEFEIEDIVKSYFNTFPPEKSDNYLIKLPEVDKLKIKYKESIIDIDKFECNVYVEMAIHELEIESFFYEQLENDSIAWASVGTTIIEGKEKSIKMVIAPGKNSEFFIKRISFKV